MVQHRLLLLFSLAWPLLPQTVQAFLLQPAPRVSMRESVLSLSGTSVDKSYRAVIPQNISLDILHEDADVLALHKPAGRSVQYARGCIEHAVVFYLNASESYGTLNSWSWPWNSPDSFEGLVHRLDKGTSGILVLAKHPPAARFLKQAFEERRVHKTYLAIAEGYPNKRFRKNHTPNTTQSTLVPEEDAPNDEQKRVSKAIKMCGRNHTKALELLKKTCDPSASCYSAAISVCRRAGERDLALGLLESILPPSSFKVRPNLLCFKTVLSLCAQDPPLCDKALDLVLEKMPACGFALHPHCVSSVIAACGRAGRLEDSLQLLQLIENQEGQPVDSCRQAAKKACQRCEDLDQARGLSTEPEVIQTTEPHLNLGRPIKIDAPIGKVGPRRMGILGTTEGGRPAKSTATSLGYSQSGSSCLSYHRIVIETGRTHQIRVHMADVLGLPLAGDTVYGPNASQKHRPMLHAAELFVPHPTSGDTLHLTCPPPSDFEELALHIIGEDAYHETKWGLRETMP